MHHGQTRGKRKTLKVCKTLKFDEIRGKLKNVMGNNKFPEMWENVVF